MCNCFPGYNGTHCEVNINECENQPCMNNGSCFDEINDFTCQCKPGLTGTLCESNVDECLNHKCEHGSSCIGKIGFYTCRCSFGYSGKFCDTRVDMLVSNTTGKMSFPKIWLGFRTWLEWNFAKSLKRSLRSNIQITCLVTKANRQTTLIIKVSLYSYCNPIIMSIYFIIRCRNHVYCGGCYFVGFGRYPFSRHTGETLQKASTETIVPFYD